MGAKVNVQTSEIRVHTPPPAATDFNSGAFSQPTDSSAFEMLGELRTVRHDPQSQEPSSTPGMILSDARPANRCPDRTTELLSWSSPVIHDWLNPSYMADWSELPGPILTFMS
jgi:hypothetical protein